jgi:hypothetical protein
VSRDPSATAFASRAKISRIATGIYAVLCPLYLGLAAFDFVHHERVATLNLALGLVWGILAVLRIVAPRSPAIYMDPNRKSIQPPFFGASTASRATGPRS